MSEITKKYKDKAIAYGILSAVIVILPLMYYTIKAFITGEPRQKLSLGISITCAGILMIINLAAKLHLRSILWILVLGINACLSNIQTLLIVMAVTTIIDELVLEPASKYYHSRYKINKEIDQRLPNEPKPTPKPKPIEPEEVNA